MDNSRYVPWATLDELLDRLLFLAISDDGKANFSYVNEVLITW